MLCCCEGQPTTQVWQNVLTEQFSWKVSTVIYEKCQLCMMVHAHQVWPVNTSSDCNHRFGLSSVSFKWTFYGLFHWIDIFITSVKSWTYTTIFQWVSHIIYSSEINVFCDRWLLRWRSFKLCMIITSHGFYQFIQFIPALMTVDLFQSHCFNCK